MIVTNHHHAVYNRRVRMHKEWYRFHLHNWRYLHDTLQPGSWNGESLEQYVRRPRCGECRLVLLMHRCMRTIKAGGYQVDWSVRVLHGGCMSQRGGWPRRLLDEEWDWEAAL
jgi:hypothetical protein